jgi:hypothetical protein
MTAPAPSPAVILAAWHDTLAAMALQSIPDPNAKG